MIIINYKYIFEKTFKIRRKRYLFLIILIIFVNSETIFEYIIFIYQEMGDVLRRILLSSSV
jgi:hypothetical protein